MTKPELQITKLLLLAVIGTAAVARPVVLDVLAAPQAPQSTAARAQTAQSPTVPQWQIDAGGKMAFDVASVKQNTAPPSATKTHSNVFLGLGDAYTPTGGLFSATDIPLFQYMVFAYKLTPDQTKAVISQLPKWASNDRFDIEARASGNPTTDQFRLMMQALLADRFKLAVHYETKQVPVLALMLDKPGKLGSQIRRHPADSPCSTAPSPPSAAPGLPTVSGGFPELCGAVIGWPSINPSGRVLVGARNVPIVMFSSQVNVGGMTGIDRPVLDKTGLTGNYDFIVEFAPLTVDGDAPPNFQPDATGPTFIEALKEQLGLKLEATTGPVDVLVIDHVEEPSAN